MKKFPEGLRPFVDVILRSRDMNAAMDSIRTINNVDPDTAKAFYDMYSGQGVNIEKAFSAFYRDVKKGQYVLEGELERIKEIIREELMVEGISEYQDAVQKHDFYHSMSDDRSAAQRGRAQEQKIKNIYNGLSGDEKLSAAIWYRDFYISKGIFKDSGASNKMKTWDPEHNFDPILFDGINYKG